MRHPGHLARTRRGRARQRAGRVERGPRRGAGCAQRQAQQLVAYRAEYRAALEPPVRAARRDRNRALLPRLHAAPGAGDRAAGSASRSTPSGQLERTRDALQACELRVASVRKLIERRAGRDAAHRRAARAEADRRGRAAHARPRGAPACHDADAAIDALRCPTIAPCRCARPPPAPHPRPPQRRPATTSPRPSTPRSAARTSQDARAPPHARPDARPAKAGAARDSHEGGHPTPREASREPTTANQPTTRIAPPRRPRRSVQSAAASRHGRRLHRPADGAAADGAALRRHPQPAPRARAGEACAGPRGGHAPTARASTQAARCTTRRRSSSRGRQRRDRPRSAPTCPPLPRQTRRARHAAARCPAAAPAGTLPNAPSTTPAAPFQAHLAAAARHPRLRPGARRQVSVLVTRRRAAGATAPEPGRAWARSRCSIVLDGTQARVDFSAAHGRHAQPPSRPACPTSGRRAARQRPDAGRRRRVRGQARDRRTRRAGDPRDRAAALPVPRPATRPLARASRPRRPRAARAAWSTVRLARRSASRAGDRPRKAPPYRRLRSTRPAFNNRS